MLPILEEWCTFLILFLIFLFLIFVILFLFLVGWRHLVHPYSREAVLPRFFPSPNCGGTATMATMDPKLLFLTKTKPFSGGPGQDWQQWVTRFEAQASQLKEDERLNCLLTLLEGTALDVFASLPATIKVSYKDAKEALAARFASSIDKLHAQAELARAVQEPGEAVDDFADRIRRLGRFAYPDTPEDDKTIDCNLTGRFLCGLRDEWLQGKLCSKDPDTLQGAIELARTLYRQREAIRAMRHSSGDASCAAATLPAPREAEIRERVEGLERRLDTLFDPTCAIASQRVSGPGAAQLSIPPSHSGGFDLFSPPKSIDIHFLNRRNQACYMM